MPLIVTSPYKSVDYAAEVLVDSPVGYWKLDETSGINAADSSGNGYDASHGVGVVVNESPLANTGGKSASYSDIAGSDTSITAAFPAFNGWDRFTVEAWVKPLVVPTGGGGFLNDDFITFHKNAIFMIINNLGYFVVVMRNGSDQYFATDQTSGGTFSPTPGQTYHVVGTYDTAIMKLYVDGVLVDSHALASEQAWQNVSFNGFGMYWSATRRYTGGLDEVAIYTYDLAADRVLAHYNAGK